MRRWVAISLSSALGALALPALGASAATPAIEVREATNVRSIYTSEFGEARPAALTYSPEEEALFTADDTVDGTLNLVGVTTIEDPAGEVTATIPETTTTADTLAFDPLAGEFTALSGNVLVAITPTGVVDQRNVSDLGLQAPQGATFDRAGRWYILDEATQTILQLSSATDPAATVVRIPIRGLAGIPLQGLAFNKADGFLYTMDPVSKILYGIDKAGRVRRAWDLNARVRDPGSMVFAPSADNTDDPAETSLFLADSGSDAVLGQVLEVSLAPAITAPVNENATLVRTSNLFALNPPVPDSAGVAYIPAQNNMMIVDSEVEEMSIYNGANMWKTTLTGGLVQTGTTVAFSDEPTGAAFRTSNSQLYISDDDANRVFLDRPGPDGRWGNGDDLVSDVNTRNFGSNDAEGVAFNNVTNHYYVVDGVGNEVYDLAPGANGVPGNGVPPQGDDVMTHFDVGQFGAQDPEGIAVDESNNNIFILDHKSQKIYETSATGTLLRTISITAANAINPAGLEYARSSASASVKNFYIVDRGLDNDSNPNENDGKMYEMSIGSAPNTAPVVDAGPDQTVQFPTTVNLSGTVTDDGQPAPPGTTTKQWTKVSGPGTVTFGTPTNVNTTASFSQAGTYVLRLTANDSVLSGSDDVTVIEVTNQAPVVNAGPDQTVAFPTTVTLNGSVTDDGLPAVPGSTTKQWTKESGPGTVTFTSPTTANTDASFSQAGTYVLRLTANDGELSGFDEVTITETPPAGNQAPVVNAGPDQTVAFPTTVTLNGSVTDDGLPAVPGSTTKQWTKESGPGTVTFTSPTTANTDASFSQAGTYVLRLTANDGELSGFDEVTITETAGGGTPTILNRSITAGSDDAEQQQSSGAVDLVSSDIELVQDGSSNNQTDGLRFTNITVPSGATITNAYIQFQVDEVTTNATSLTVRGELSPNPPTFTTATNNVSSRPNTTATVPWTNVPGWPTVGARGPAQQTPEIKTIVQEIIGQGGWASGNAMAFKITGTGKRTAEAFESGAALAASLHLEYTTGGGPANQAPVVNAGPDQTVAFPTTVTLNGSVTDDGLPAVPGSTTKQWTKESGPGTVTFTSPTTANTDASFSQAGTYVLRLTANDGELSGFDEVTITETPPAGNQAPVVNAGPDQTVAFPTTVTLNGSVTDDGLPAVPGSTTKQWTKESGPGTVTFTSPTTANTDASFSQAGTYVLRLTANDGELSGFDEVTITETAGGGTPTILNRSITAGSDDAEQQQSSGAVDLVSSDIELVQDGSSNNQTDGLRFTNITVPSGATITNAYIQFQVDEVTTNATSLTVRGELSPNPPTFTTATNNVSSRPNTTATVPWTNVPGWPTVGARGPAQQTPEIKTIVQEIIGQGGWASGNAMAFKITGTGKRTAEAFESGAALAASLHLEYTT